MIKLDVKPYCQNCPHFEPEVTKHEDKVTVKDPSTLLIFSQITPEIRYEYNTIVYCKHRDRCVDITNNAIDNYVKENNNG